MNSKSSRPLPAAGGHTSDITSQTDTDAFELDGTPTDQPDFDLEPVPPETSEEDVVEAQQELWLPEVDPERPDPTPQLELEGMGRPVYEVSLTDGRVVRFQHANTLLESLESQQVDVHYQCREGYCGSCRARLLAGEVYYVHDPLAWVDDDEVLLCCCIPRGPIQLELPH